ncbi:hypothetical protein [Desulfovibrio sp. TomC]|uniref:hypothetical protein n=1 Tax=Desulfovibrio sp. TomC TaxID=1562888 RepID=UPI0005744039|nr:hypothetical protein [Desulfovibrio sp. TomC]KHK03804.1 hypothetical protein NY78_0860 [Desulfovibrio sp. TomC]
MRQSDRFRKCIAFTAAGLVVIWTCGSFLTAVYKLVYHLVLGAWPNTLLYGIVPEGWLPGAAGLPPGELLDRVWAFLLGCDVLTWLLILPPLFLLPCLLLLRAEHGGIIPALRSTARPFTPDLPRSAGPLYPMRRPGPGGVSTKN